LSQDHGDSKQLLRAVREIKYFMKKEEKLEKYLKIFSEYITDSKSTPVLEYVYWKFPNNWGAWMYYKSESGVEPEINRNDGGQYSFEDWLTKAGFYPTTEIVPVRYQTKRDNDCSLKKIRENKGENKGYISAIPDYEGQNIISYPIFDPDPITVINLLTKIKCLKDES